MRNLCDYSPDIHDIIEGVRAFIRSEVVDRQDKAGDALTEPQQRFGSDGRYSETALRAIYDVRTSAAEAGFYTMFVPVSLGGAGLDHRTLYQVWEDIFHSFGPRYWLKGHVVCHWARGPSAVLEHARPEVLEKVLPNLMSGRTSLCFGMSEPDAGSDANAMRTYATPDGEGWRISGSKIWITNGPYADFALIFAVTDPPEDGRRSPGISAFLVPTDVPGFAADPNIRMWGETGSEEATLYLDNIYVGPEWIIGERGRGFEIAISGASTGRLYNSAKSVGTARWALEQALAYVQNRQAFGSPISANQGVMFPLSSAAMEVHAAHVLGLNTANMLDAGLPAIKELSMSKAFSTDVAERAIDVAIQSHGAIGFTNELGLIEAWHTVRKSRVADGTSGILLRTISNRLLKGEVAL